MRGLWVAIGALLLALWSGRAHATPALARQQNVGCPVCHTVFPELNTTGRQYKENGYRFLEVRSGRPAIPGKDLGGGVAVDTAPGLAVIIESLAMDLGPNARGTEQITTQPLESVELMGTMTSGRRWSAMSEFEAEADEDYEVEGSALIRYNAAKPISVFAGWAPLLWADGYNALSEARRVDHQEHAVGDFTGSFGFGHNDGGGLLGLTGRVGRFFYIAVVSPGPGVIPSRREPLDYLARAAFDLSDDVAVGAALYVPNTRADVSFRPMVDVNAVTILGTGKLAGLYDTFDDAFGIEGGWDVSIPIWRLDAIPQARFDLVSGLGETVVTPMLGFALQQSGARVGAELAWPLGPRPLRAPDLQIRFTGAF